MQTDTLLSTGTPPSAIDESTATEAIEHLVRHLGCASAQPDDSGIYSLVLDEALCLALWPDASESFVIIGADVAVPAGMDGITLHRAAMSFNLGAASVRAPVLALDGEDRLVLAWTVPTSLEQAEAGMDYFLENLGMASAFLAGGSPGGEASTPVPAQDGADVSSGAKLNEAKALILSAIARRLATEPLVLDDDGMCLMQNGDDRLIFIKSAPDEVGVSLGVELGTVRQGDEPLLALALAYNFEAVTQNSAALALDEGNEALLLVTYLPATVTTPEEVEAGLESFFRAYASCQGELLNLEHFEDVTAWDEEGTAEEIPVELPPGSIRV